MAKYHGDVCGHVDIKLLTQWESRHGAEAMITKPNFHSPSVFLENLVTIELRKLEVKFDKPLYTVDICSRHIQDVFVRPLFREKRKIMYTDTDILIPYRM